MKILLLSLCGVCCIAQTLTPNMTPIALVAGSATAVPVQLNFISGIDPIAALEWSTVFPASIGGTWTAGTAITAANKTLACSVTGTICIAYGLNQNIIATGVAGVLQLLAASSVRGPQTVTIGGGLGAGVSALGVAVSTSNLLVTVYSPFDLNQDGKVDALDLALVIQQAIGVTVCGTADFNHDGVCNVLDVVALVVDSLSPTP